MILLGIIFIVIFTLSLLKASSKADRYLEKIK
ncbi:hypothetical protein QOZ91_003009 [Clostridium sardiniense]|nr:hypothetical protein [Clostridium sardiniense]